MASNATDSTAAPGAKRFSALRIVLAILLGLLVLALAAGAWLFNTESGTRAAFSAARSLTGGTVQAEGVRGRLASSVQIDRLLLDLPDQRVEMKDLRLDWALSDLWQRRLHVDRLRIGALTIFQEIEEEQPEPARLPDSITLPVELQVDNARIDTVRIIRGPAELLTISGLSFSLAFDGEQYRLGLDRAELRPGERPGSMQAGIDGQATLSTTKPYPLSGRFAATAKAEIQERTLGTSGNIGLDGSLAELLTTIDFAFQQAQISGRAELRPFTEQPLGKANLGVRGLDLAAINPDLPTTAFDLTLSSNEDGTGALQLANAESGLYNNEKVPLTDLSVAFRQENADFIFEKITAALGTPKQPAGTMTGSGRYGDGTLTLALRTPSLNLQQLDQRFPATRLSGKIEADHAENAQRFVIDFTEQMKKNPLSIFARGSLADERLTISQANLKVGGGEASFSGHSELADQQSFAAQGRVSKFRPQDLGNFPQLPRMVLNGKFDVAGKRAPQLAVDLSFNITDSQLAGNPLRGEGRARLRGEQVSVPNLLLVAGANRIAMKGELAERKSELSFEVQAPKLAQLGSGFSGAVVANGSVRGTVAKPQVDVKWDASDLRLRDLFRIADTRGSAKLDIDRNKPFLLDSAAIDASARGLKSDAQQLASMTARVRFSPQPNAPLALNIRASGISAGDFKADEFVATADGTTASHSLEARLTEAEQKWLLAASGGLRDLARTPEWQGSIDRMQASGRLDANLAAPAPITVSQERVRLERFRLNSDVITIAIEQFVRNRERIATRGRIERVQLGRLLKFVGPSPNLSTDLQLEGEWDVNIADTVNGTLNLRRTGGDLVIRGGVPVTLGLNLLQADISAKNGRIDLELNARGKQLGQIDVDANTRVAGGVGGMSIPPDAPLSGRAVIDVPTIAWIGPMISPTSVTEGRLQSNFSASGTYSNPQLAGQIGGSGLRFYSSDLGIDFRNGVLESEFQGSRLLVKSLRFQNDGGQLTIAGPISFDEGKPGAQLALAAERFRLLNQSDRRLTLSGQSRINLAGGKASVKGDFTVDSGYFDIGREGTPQLSDDVIIVGRTEKEKGKVIPALDIRIGLGNGVRLDGRGLNAVVVGEVRVQNAPGEELQAYGSLRVAKGTFAAYGRELAIERGAVRFTGPVNNPALNILAMRRSQDLEVEAGVSIQGTVLSPRISLVSEPSVPDAEKLSWLVLGRGLSGVGEGEIGSLQSAAGALLAQGAAAGVQSQIANAFGLDTLSVGRSEDGLQQRIITLGKQLSSRLYVSYQQGLESANSAVLLRYALSPKLSVEVEAGARSALSLFYNITFD